MRKVIIDASVALKWFFKEDGSEKALELQGKLKDGIVKAFVPQIFFFEVINVIKTKPTTTLQHVERAIKIVFNLPFSSQKISQGLLEKANFYAQKYDLTIYDASYIALAKTLGVDLITADEKLRNKVKLRSVRSFKDYKI